MKKKKTFMYRKFTQRVVEVEKKKKNSFELL